MLLKNNILLKQEEYIISNEELKIFLENFTVDVDEAIYDDGKQKKMDVLIPLAKSELNNLFIDDEIIEERYNKLMNRLNSFDPDREKFNIQLFKDTTLATKILPAQLCSNTIKVILDIVPIVNEICNYFISILQDKPIEIKKGIRDIYKIFEDKINLKFKEKTLTLDFDNYLNQRDLKGLPLHELGYNVPYVYSLVNEYRKLSGYNKQAILTIKDIFIKYLNKYIKEYENIKDKKEYNSKYFNRQVLEIEHEIRSVYCSINIVNTILKMYNEVYMTLDQITYYTLRTKVTFNDQNINTSGDNEPDVIEYTPEKVLLEDTNFISLEEYLKDDIKEIDELKYKIESCLSSVETLSNYQYKISTSGITQEIYYKINIDDGFNITCKNLNIDYIVPSFENFDNKNFIIANENMIRKVFNKIIEFLKQLFKNIYNLIIKIKDWIINKLKNNVEKTILIINAIDIITSDVGKNNNINATEIKKLKDNFLNSIISIILKNDLIKLLEIINNLYNKYLNIYGSQQTIQTKKYNTKDVEYIYQVFMLNELDNINVSNDIKNHLKSLLQHKVLTPINFKIKDYILQNFNINLEDINDTKKFYKKIKQINLLIIENNDKFKDFIKSKFIEIEKLSDIYIKNLENYKNNLSVQDKIQYELIIDNLINNISIAQTRFYNNLGINITKTLYTENIKYNEILNEYENNILKFIDDNNVKWIFKYINSDETHLHFYKIIDGIPIFFDYNKNKVENANAQISTAGEFRILLKSNIKHLNKNIIDAIIYHELYHLKNNHSIKNILEALKRTTKNMDYNTSIDMDGNDHKPFFDKLKEDYRSLEQEIQADKYAYEKCGKQAILEMFKLFDNTNVETHQRLKALNDNYIGW